MNKTYIVTKVKDGKEVDNIFVLDPQNDRAARAALAVYAQTTSNLKVRDFIRSLLKKIDKSKRKTGVIANGQR
jgi:hypothetical protein